MPVRTALLLVCVIVHCDAFVALPKLSLRHATTARHDRCSSDLCAMTAKDMSSDVNQAIERVSAAQDDDDTSTRTATCRWIISTSIPVVTLLMFDHMIRICTAGSTLPPAVTGMLSLFAFMISLLCAGQLPIARRLQVFLSPASVFLNNWIAAFWVPSIVVLPFVKSGLTFPSLLTFIGVGFIGMVLNVFITGRAAEACSKRQWSQECTMPADIPPAPLPTPYSLPQAQAFLAKVGLIAAVAAVAIYRMRPLAGWPLCVNVALLCSTLCGLITGQRFPAHIQAKLHPFFASLASTMAAIVAISAASGATPTELLALFRPPDSIGAGTILSRLLGPTIIAYALPMYAYRQLMNCSAVTIAISVLLSSLSSLGLSALLVRAFSLATPMRLAFFPRAMSIPFALEACDLLGAEKSLVLFPVLTSGISFILTGTKLLDTLGIRDPAARGLAGGCASHGGGVIAVTSEDEAVPFAVVGMVLTGAVTMGLLCIVPFRNLLATIALGASAASARS